MLRMHSLFFALYLSTLVASVRINLDLTDRVCESDSTERHHCLHVRTRDEGKHHALEIITYCLTECSTDLLHSEASALSDDASFTFEQLARQNVTSHQLYSWSAPIDLAEKYQQYLDQAPDATTNLSDVFYNCTWPRFGPSCQFTFAHLSSESYLSSDELVQDYYASHPYKLTTLTCYEHLTCDRGPWPLCLDWSEICDGRLDCQDGRQDEEHCWQLEVNECQEDEYRCNNGQCVSTIFYNDNSGVPDCLDGFDEPRRIHRSRPSCENALPNFYCENWYCSILQYLSPHFLTSACSRDRDSIFTNTILSAQPPDLSDDCWLAFQCVLRYRWLPHVDCNEYCENGRCQEIIRDNCSTPLLYLSAVPILSGHVTFAFSKEYLFDAPIPQFPQYVCVNTDFCEMIDSDDQSLQFENMTCYHAENIRALYNRFSLRLTPMRYLIPTLLRIQTCASLPSAYFNFCHRHSLYQCRNSSKCIPKHRLLDASYDCYFGDDEQLEFVSRFTNVNDSKAFFMCSSGKYISIQLVNNDICDCLAEPDDTCDDEYSERQYAKTHISFQTQCDGFTELRPLIIDGRPMTDETDCQAWLCDNVYTRCDNIWNCWDGRDEVDCNVSLPIQCPTNARMCGSPETNNLTCLPVEKVNDGHIDCLGAMDERQKCRKFDPMVNNDFFSCTNDSDTRCIPFASICDGRDQCAFGDDEQFCQQDDRDELNVYFRGIDYFNEKPAVVHFSLSDSLIRKQQSSTAVLKQQINQPPDSFHNQCHRGLNLRPRTTDSSIACLCPPSYYGAHCQFQNQRISLTLHFRALSDAWQTTFVIAILLVDHTHHRRIHSAHQLTYLPLRDCQIKFNLNLLFATRPSNASLNHSIHFDIYEQHSHHYRASYLAPIIFPFLPVYRLALQLDIPRLRTHQTCTDLDCGRHGRCLRYARVFHSPSRSMASSFCQCEEGWSGRHCTIPISCSCSPQALCLGTLMGSNRSICLCSPGRFGPRCYLSYEHICQGKDNRSPCLNGGQCIPSDEYKHSYTPRYFCVCPRGFTGDQCQHNQTQLIISFDSHIVKQLSSSMLVHFIRSYPGHRHENATTVRSIPFNFASVSVFWPHPFHVVFLEFHHRHYYLAFVRSVFNQSEVKMQTMLRSIDRCPHIRELLSPTLLRSHPLLRIKSYHSLCLQKISCFYDDAHFCLCQPSPRNGEGRREANCLEYDHDRKFDCLGRNGCENGGQCFQDNPTCPQTSVCMCGECSYGRRCQFTMDGFRLSLDAILGYHIEPHVSLRQQPTIVHVALSITIVMTIVGTTNGLLVLITFKNKRVCQVGCGYYFFDSAVTTLLTVALFFTKFVILLTTQMGLLTNRSFLLLQCRLVDYLLRVFLNLDQWLDACVSLERAFITVQGIRFNKAKSRRYAKYVIAGLISAMLASGVYDPIHRRLINDNMNGGDDESDRIWCFVSYPRWMTRIDSAMHMVLFFVPFFINISSAGIIIWCSAAKRWKAHQNIRWKAIVGEQVRQHKHILIGPLTLVALAVPRLVLSIVSGCMKSNRQSHIYLAGYFISFAPVILTCILFVFPSKSYREELQNSIGGYRKIVSIFIARFRR